MALLYVHLLSVGLPLAADVVPALGEATNTLGMQVCGCFGRAVFHEVAFMTGTITAGSVLLLRNPTLIICCVPQCHGV